MTIVAYRDAILGRGASPSWLRRTVGGQLLYTIGLHIDLLQFILVQGVKARFPGFHPDFTPYLCRQCGITRGPEETEEQISERLRFWRQSRRAKGSWTALLWQLRGYLSPHNPRIRIVSARGRYQEISSTGEITVGDMVWNWDGLTSTYPKRFWVLIWVPSSLWQNDGTWSSPGTIGDGGVIGSTATMAQVVGMRSLIREWSRVSSRHVYTILIWNDVAWQSQQPDGTWDVQANRNPSANYWPGEGFS